MITPTEFDFSVHHLRFTVEATTPIEMGAYKGSALRGAWTGYMRRAYCGAPPNVRTDPMHEAICPVCYLTSRSTGAESRRPFALQPPLSRQPRYEPGERFTFGFTLFGNAQTLFPYVLLAVREVGESQGIGRRLDGGSERGRYRLVQVTAVDPHSGQVQTLFQEPEMMVMQPTLRVDAEGITRRAQQLATQAAANDGRLQLKLLTPLRVIHENRLMHTYAFVPFFQRLVERLYGLGEHYSADPSRYDRPALRAEVARLLPLAASVTVVEDQTRWWDVKGYSSRLNKPHYLGGLVGDVTLASDEWTTLLPYLLWGQSIQLGKNVVKGGGWYQFVEKS